MSEHLEKAQAALAAASEMDIELGETNVPKSYSRLLDLAMIQAQVAQAEALWRIARRLEQFRL